MSFSKKHLLVVIALIVSNFSFAVENDNTTTSPSPDERFTTFFQDKKNRVILDKKWGLLWEDQLTVITREFYQDVAKIYCSNLNFGSLNHWRVPTYGELMSLIDYQKSEPATSAPFIHQSIGDFWTSTVFAKDQKYYWYVDFLYGYTSVAPVGKPLLLRCVHDVIE
jgi:hypothetical protein